MLNGKIQRKAFIFFSDLWRAVTIFLSWFSIWKMLAQERMGSLVQMKDRSSVSLLPVRMKRVSMMGSSSTGVEKARM